MEGVHAERMDDSALQRLPISIDQKVNDRWADPETDDNNET